MAKAKNDNIIGIINGIKKSPSKTVTVLQSTIDTLLFFSFGITLDDNYDFIVDTLIEKAYKDATLMGAFNTKVKEINENKIEKSKSGAKTKINDFLNNTADMFSSADWHEKICKIIKGEFENEQIQAFTIGNSQKWINMTLKYIYLLSSFTFTDEDFNKLAECVWDNAGKLHVPIDSYMIDAIAFAGIKGLGENAKDAREKYKRPSDKIEKWSNIKEYNDKKGFDYEGIQQNLEDYLSKKMYRIDWEEQAWLYISKNLRKPKEKSGSKE